MKDDRHGHSQTRSKQGLLYTRVDRIPENSTLVPPSKTKYFGDFSPLIPRFLVSPRPQCIPENF